MIDISYYNLMLLSLEYNQCMCVYVYMIAIGRYYFHNTYIHIYKLDYAQRKRRVSYNNT